MLRSSLMYFSVIFFFLLSKSCVSPLLCNIKIQFSQVTNGYSILLNIVIYHVIGTGSGTGIRRRGSCTVRMTRNGKQIQTDRKQIKRHAGRVKGQLYSTNTTA